jgi:hypothetical protein
VMHVTLVLFVLLLQIVCRGGSSVCRGSSSVCRGSSSVCSVKQLSVSHECYHSDDYTFLNSLCFSFHLLDVQS